MTTVSPPASDFDSAIPRFESWRPSQWFLHYFWLLAKCPRTRGVCEGRVAAKGRQIETEAAPIRYVAELVGADTDSERAIRWLIALMVLCCDPLATALTAAASARRSTT